MFEHIKMKVENLRMYDSSFIHLHIKFHKLTLTRGSSFIKSLELIAKKMAVINPKK